MTTKHLPHLAAVMLILATLACGETASIPTPQPGMTEESTPAIEATAAPTLVAEPSSTNTPPPTKTPPLPTNTPVPTSTPRPEPVYLGDIAEARGHFFVAIAVEDPATRPGIFHEPEAGKKLVAVEIIVGNIDGDPFNSNVLYTTLVDSEGFAYGAESVEVEDSLELLDVEAGEKVRGWAGFNIPEDSTPASVKYDIDRETLQVGLAQPPDDWTPPALSPYNMDPDIPKLGGTATASGYTLSALTVEDPATRPGIFHKDQVGKKLIAVEIVVGNESGDNFSSNVLYTTLVDTNGFLYGAESVAVEDSLELLDVNPGEKVKGWAGFVVPENAIPATIKYKMNRVVLQVNLTE